MTTFEKMQLICKTLSEKKGVDIVYIDVADRSSLCDYFVICSGRSTTQVRSLAENLEEKLSKEYAFEPRRREGVREGRWAVLDYTDVIVHVFCDEERDFYCLERLWEDGKNLTHYLD